jgi:hypothetical protein
VKELRVAIKDCNVRESENLESEEYDYHNICYVWTKN